jgi:hypothetical protein
MWVGCSSVSSPVPQFDSPNIKLRALPIFNPLKFGGAFKRLTQLFIVNNLIECTSMEATSDGQRVN